MQPWKPHLNRQPRAPVTLMDWVSNVDGSMLGKSFTTTGSRNSMNGTTTKTRKGTRRKRSAQIRRNCKETEQRGGVGQGSQVRPTGGSSRPKQLTRQLPKATSLSSTQTSCRGLQGTTTRCFPPPRGMAGTCPLGALLYGNSLRQTQCCHVLALAKGSDRLRAGHSWQQAGHRGRLGPHPPTPNAPQKGLLAMHFSGFS